MPIDSIRLDFDASSLMTLNIVLGVLMFGVALELKPRDFRELARAPKAPAIGLVAQFILLPMITFGITRLLPIAPSVKLGMILVSACPGGNVSNFIAHLAGGRVSTSVGMTAVSTLAALVMTPVNLTFWGQLHPETAALLEAVALDPKNMLLSVGLLLGIPVTLGMTLGQRLPQLAERARTPVRIITLLFFGLFVSVAFSKNLGPFEQVIGQLFVPVALMNATAFFIGWLASRLGGLDARDRRAVTIEVGIQNSGLGLVLVFNFFDGLGGMAVVCAWWGIWHIVAGVLLALAWTRIESLRPEGPAAA